MAGNDDLLVEKLAELLPTHVARVWRALRKKNYSAAKPLPPERELAQELKVARQTLREALAFLCHLGLAERTQKKGTFLRKWNPTESAEHISTFVAFHAYHLAASAMSEDRDPIREVRAAIEGGTAFQATWHRTSRDVLEMDGAINELDQLRKRFDFTIKDGGRLDRNDLNEWLKADRNFHVAVVNAAHNDALSLFDFVIVRSFASKDPPLDVCTGKTAQRIIAEHRAIFSCIEKGVQKKRSAVNITNAVRTELLMWAHIAFPKERPRKSKIAPILGIELNA